ncbi:MAG: hypothetical protein JO168_08390 [Solirubrobacterales bacterium]|nr:hypothetical protein [Solirubrobacterales bacterium]MBV9717677.1 hypothetical protein [Solirubrobacterales bacterium]
MTRAEAQARAEQLNRAAPDRSRHHWTIRDRGGGDWEVLRVTVPGVQFGAGPLRAATEQRPRPDEPPDPRPSLIRQIPPYGPG